MNSTRQNRFISCASILFLFLTCVSSLLGMKRAASGDIESQHDTKIMRTDTPTITVKEIAIEKKLPTGIQSFSKLIEGNHLYVDKTETIHKLISSGSCYFLARPRRFGKSLLVSTLKEIFSGNRTLFESLAIEKTDYAWHKHPVIHLSFSAFSSESADALKKDIVWTLQNIAEKHQIDIRRAPSIQTMFKTLIEQLSSKNKVVVLIDEYDSPIIKNINTSAVADACREVLRNFYAVLKDADEYLAFIFVTGVTQSSKTTIFSGLNSLRDLTYSKDAALLLGYSHSELIDNFSSYIDRMALRNQISSEEIIEKLRYWYNGYQFREADTEAEVPALRVYNPFSILLCLTEGTFSDFWTETGVPQFLPELIKAQQYSVPEIEGSEVNRADIKIYDFNKIKILPLLWQTGYLTIDSYDTATGNYKLRYPNQEVKLSFLDHLLSSFTETDIAPLKKHLQTLESAIKKNDLALFFKTFAIFFANVPYTIQLSMEKYYQTIFYVILRLMGAEVEVEVATNAGRIDAFLKTPSYIYIFEFKLNKTAQNALDQIKEMQYYQKFLHLNKQIFMVGVNFDTKIRNIDDWVIEMYQPS